MKKKKEEDFSSAIKTTKDHPQTRTWKIIEISKIIGLLTMSIMLIVSFIYGWWLISIISAISVLFLGWLNRKFFKKTKKESSLVLLYDREKNSTNENHR